MSLCTIEKKQNNYEIGGRINFDTVSYLYNRPPFFEAEGLEIRLDFAKVTYADSSAIALLLSWLRLAKEKDIAIVLANLPDQLLEIANVCEVKPFLEHYMRSDHG